jgi:hypothetical protein
MNKDILYTSLFKDCLTKKLKELDLNVKPIFSSNKDLRVYLNALFSNKLDEYKSKNPLLKIDFTDTFFNRKLLPNIIPSTIVEIFFSNDFNQLLDENVLPKGLKKLIFGTDFNQVLNENVLPQSLTYLHLGKRFNQKIKSNILPNSLTYLHLGYDFNHVLDIDVLPFLLYFCSSFL